MELPGLWALFRLFAALGYATYAAAAVFFLALLWFIQTVRRKRDLPSRRRALIAILLSSGIPALCVILGFKELLSWPSFISEKAAHWIAYAGIFLMYYSVASLVMLLVFSYHLRRTRGRSGYYYSHIDGIPFATIALVWFYFYVEQKLPDDPYYLAGPIIALTVVIPANNIYRFTLRPGQLDLFDRLLKSIGDILFSTPDAPPQSADDDRVRAQGLQALQEEFRTNLPAVIEEPQEVVPIEEAAARYDLEKPQLMLKRSQRNSLMGNPIFVLDARLYIPPDDRKLVGRYKLSDAVVYDSKARRQRQESAQDRMERSKNGASFSDSAGAQAWSATKQLFNVGMGAASAISASLSLRITVAGLMRGVHVECKSMDELLEAENAMADAATTVAEYLRIAETFDGREIVVEL